MEGLIEEFLKFLERERGTTENTIENYRGDLRQFNQFRLIQPGEVDQKLIEDYLLELKQKGYASSSINRKLSSLRSFFNFLEGRGLIQENPAKKIGPFKRVPRPTPKALTKEERERFLKVLAQSAKPQAIRDLAIIELILATGLKVSEIVNLDIQMVNLDPENPRIKIIRGREKREIPLSAKARQSLSRYLNEIRPNLLPPDGKERALFLNFDIKRKGRLTRQGIFLMIKNYAKMAELETKVNPRVLRYSFLSQKRTS